MSFPEDFEHRPASVYADFLLPHLRTDASLLDCGCASGSITVGLSPSVARAIGLDLQVDTIRPAMTFVEEQRIPNEELLHRFYSLREELWAIEGLARPREGRNLRRLLGESGFINVRASARFISHGTADATRRFAEARAAECSGAWFASRCLAHGLLSGAELHEIQSAWEEWGSSGESFAAFSWCRAVGWKP